jgi:hypothetical protein
MHDQPDRAVLAGGCRVRRQNHACGSRIFFAPNKTIRELHEIVKSGGADLDPLKEFSELARGELRSLA